MSLFRKLVILFGVVVVVIFSATLALVYTESHQTIVKLATQRAVSIIQTIDSDIASNIPNYHVEEVLLHLKKQDPDILSFDIYKLNGSLYDIASTNPAKIGTQASSSEIIALGSNKPTTSLHGTIMEYTTPIYNGLYSVRVKFSIADDLRWTHILLMRVLWIGCLAILLAVLAAWLFTRIVLSKPLSAVVSAVNEVATGNLNVDLSSSNQRQDEIGELARSFERMTTSLQQLIGRIAQTADELRNDFEELVRNGDSTASGALHVSDVIVHVTGTMEEQASHLDRLKEQLTSIGVIDIPYDTELSVGIEDEIHRWIHSVQAAANRTDEMRNQLQSLSATTNGQLKSIQEVNRTAARLSQMANELRALIVSLEI